MLINQSRNNCILYNQRDATYAVFFTIIIGSLRVKFTQTIRELLNGVTTTMSSE